MVDQFTLVEIAGERLLNGQQGSRHLEELAFAHPTDTITIHEALAELTSADGPVLAERTVRRWRLILSEEVLNGEQNDEEFLVAVERLWADVGYPHDMEGMIYYMPMPDDTELENLSVAERRHVLRQRFVRFIEREFSELTNRA